MRTREFQHAAVVDVALAQVTTLLLVLTCTVSTESISFALAWSTDRNRSQWHVLLARDGDLRADAFHEVEDDALTGNVFGHYNGRARRGIWIER